MSLAARFWNKAGVGDPGACWEWTGYRDRYGYGALWRNEQERSAHAHRVSWELHRGPIPDGMAVLHRCDNRACVNPDHLFLGTNRDNINDMLAKGRQAKGDQVGRRLYPERYPTGERVATAKLTAGKVAEIRSRFAAGGVTCVALAREYGVSNVQIGNIVKRLSWRQV